MGLSWPLLAAPMLIAIGVFVWLLRREDAQRWRGDLPLLARAFRLTALPEYQRAIRLHERMMVVALVSATVSVFALLGASLRPVRVYHPHPPGSDTPYVDIMLCFGPLLDFQFAEKTGLLPLLGDIRSQVDGFGNQRIGMTHEFYRVFPVTADHRWVSQRLGDIIETGEKYLAAEHDYAALANLETAVYERSSYQAGVEPNVVDTIANCAMGLPAAGADNGRGKMLIYIGDPLTAGDPGASSTPAVGQIYSRDLLEKTIKTANIQVSAIAASYMSGAPGLVEKLVDETGGRRIVYTKVEEPMAGGPVPPLHIENQKAELSHAVDIIFSSPPAAALDRARKEASAPFKWDVPDLLLQIALLAGVALAAARLGMRL